MVMGDDFDSPQELPKPGHIGRARLPPAPSGAAGKQAPGPNPYGRPQELGGTIVRRLLSIIALTGLLLSGVPAAAGPSAGGLSSDNIEFITHVPFEVGTATGARVIGK